MRALFAALVATTLLAAEAAAQDPTPTSRPTQAAASTTPHRFGWVLEGALEFGGDEFVEILFTDGSTQTLTTGQGGTIAFGAEYRVAPRLLLRGTAGFKFTSTAADNSNAMFTRIPLELVAHYALTSDWRLGAGAAYHAAINFDGDNLGPDLAFDPAIGGTVELGWRWVAVTYTAMNYRDEFGNDYNASAIGASFSWVFGKR